MTLDLLDPFLTAIVAGPLLFITLWFIFWFLGKLL